MRYELRQFNVTGVKCHQVTLPMGRHEMAWRSLLWHDHPQYQWSNVPHLLSEGYPPNPKVVLWFWVEDFYWAPIALARRSEESTWMLLEATTEYPQ